MKLGPTTCRSIALAAVALSCVVASGEVGAAQRTFVSTAGSDASASCSLGAPCRGFAKAITLTDPSGEIVVLDSGGYGSVTIGKSVTITSPAGVYAGVSVFAGQDGIVVGPGSGKVVLRGLTINGQGGNVGIRIQAGEVHVENVVVSNMAQVGLRVDGGTSARLSGVVLRSNLYGMVVGPDNSLSVVVRETEISRNTSGGVVVGSATSGVETQVTLERSTVTGNGGPGVLASAGTAAPTVVVVTQSVVSANAGSGVAASSSSTVYVRDTAVTRNGTGLQQQSTGVLNACGSNLLVANGVAQSGTINVNAAACLDQVAGGTVTNVATGAGLTGGPITTTGTIGLATTQLLPTTACTPNQVPQWNGSAWACAAVGGGGTVTSVGTGAGLTGGPITGSGTISVANGGVTAAMLASNGCASGQLLKWNGSAWACASDLDTNSGGTVTSVGSGTGLSGGPVTGSGTLSIATGYQLPQGCTNSQVAKSNGAGGWTCAADAAGSGTVTSVAAGSGLTGGTITTSGTIAVNTATIQARVLGDCAMGTAIAAIYPDGSIACSAVPFLQGGNGFAATGVLGTTDDNALDIRVNNSRVMRYEPNAISPNVIGGSLANDVTAGVRGATIGGGGVPVLVSDPDIGNGAPNRVADAYGTVGGGWGNVAGDGAGTVTDRPFATVGGGRFNNARGHSSTVGGGVFNNAYGWLSTVGGGGSNTASGTKSMVGGGYLNQAVVDYSTVGGGTNNVAGEGSSTVGGGASNTASGLASTVPGGLLNTASGAYSFAAGGQDNLAQGAYSFAAGRRARAMADGVFILSDSTDADFTGNNPNVFAAGFTGGIGMWTSKSFTTGCYIAAGGGSWTCTSSRDEKKDFEAVDPQAVLQRVAALPITEWRYKTEASGARHLGPMAQDFRAAFALGDSDKTIGVLDAAGVALAAIQGLNAKLETTIAEQAREIAELRDRLAQVESLRGELAEMRHALAMAGRRTGIAMP